VVLDAIASTEKLRERLMNARKSSAVAAFCFAIGIASAPTANAGTLLSGDVTVGNYSPNMSTVYGDFIGSGPTTGAVYAGPLYPFTFTADSFTWDDPIDTFFTAYSSTVTFNGFILSFTDVAPITGVTYASGAEPATTISFNSNTIWLGYNGAVTPRPGGSTTFDVSFATPEPATWAMMLLGFGGLCFAGHCASRKSAALAV
jgi:hypothetical protein